MAYPGVASVRHGTRSRRCLFHVYIQTWLSITEGTSMYSYARLAMVAFSRDVPLPTMRYLLYRLCGVYPQDPDQHLTKR